MSTRGGDHYALYRGDLERETNNTVKLPFWAIVLVSLGVWRAAARCGEKSRCRARGQRAHDKSEDRTMLARVRQSARASINRSPGARSAGAVITYLVGFTDGTDPRSAFHNSGYQTRLCL